MITFNGKKCNSNQQWNIDKCWCECKNFIYPKMIMSGILLNVIVKMENIQQVLWMIQRLSGMKLQSHMMKK